MSGPWGGEGGPGRARRRTAAVVLPLALALGACDPPSDGGGDAPPDPSALLDADRAFALATAERGAEGWVSWFAEDGAMLVPGREIRGHEEIRAAMEPAFAEPGYALEWSPERGEIAASGDLGYTVGRYRRTRLVEGDTTRSTGAYVTVWRRQPDGSWRVALDLGVPDPEER